MALLYASRKLCFTITRQIEINSKFHTLIKTEHNLIKKQIFNENLNTKRNFFGVFKRKSKSKIRLVDKPPDGFELIYRCHIDHYFSVIQHFGFYATVFVCIGAIFSASNSLMPKVEETTGKNLLINDGQITVKENQKMFFIAAYLSLAFIVCLIMGRLPMRIYCNPETQKYIITFYGPIPNQLKTLKLEAGQVKEISDESLFGFHSRTKEVFQHTKTGEVFWLPAGYFRYPADFYNMLSLQKNSNKDCDSKEKKDEMKRNS